MKRITLFLMAFLLSFSLYACSRPQAPDPTATPTLESILPQGSVESTGSPAGNRPANPSPTPDLSTPNPVQITELQHIQTGNRLTVIAKLRNILKDAIVRNLEIEVLALDASGNRIAQDFSTLTYLFPQETTGMVQAFDLISGLEAVSVQLRIHGGIADRSLRYQQPLKLSAITAFESHTNWSINAWLENKDPYTYTQVELHGILYNKKGEIIGGGSSFQDFVPEKDRMGVSVPVTLREDEEIVRVELYPWLTNYSASLEGGTWWDTIAVKDWNYSVDSYHQLSGGAILKNKTNNLIAHSYYILTVKDEYGRVCLASQGYIDLIWPQEELVFSPGLLLIPGGAKPKSVDFFLVPGEFDQRPLAYNPLLTAQPVLKEDSTVQVSVINNLSVGLSATQVYILLTDENDKIVGGGQTITEALAGNSSISVSVPVSFIGDSGKIRIKAFATLPNSVQIGP